MSQVPTSTAADHPPLPVVEPTDLTARLLAIGITLAAEKDFNCLADKILTEAKSLCYADGGTLYLKTLDDHLKFVIMTNDTLNVHLGGTTGTEVALPPIPLACADGSPNHANVAAYVALTGELAHIPDVYEAEGFDFSGARAYDERSGYRCVSCLTVPLKNHRNKVVGVLQLINAQDPQTGAITTFSAERQNVVMWLAGQAAVALDNHLLLAEQTNFLKAERDLQIGRMIQQDFLPEVLPQVPGWEIAARFYPAREVAGDFYDAFMMHHGRIGIVIADVCDKGVGAALFMSLFRSLIRILARQNYSLGLLDVLTDEKPMKKVSPESSPGRRRLPNIGSQALKNAIQLTNDYIAANHARTNMFATVFFGVIDPSTGHMQYINGGHESPIICDREGHIRTRLASTGPAVGMMEGLEFRIEEIQLEPGDILMTYTDGVPEAHDGDRQMFGEPRLFELVQAPAATAAELLDRVDTTVRAFIADAPQFDDITMLAVRRAEPLALETAQRAGNAIQ